MPEHCRHLVEWFWDLNSSRSQGFNGPNPISLTEIANWSAMTGTIINRDEVSILRAMDAAFIKATGEEQAEAAKRAESKE